jgi:hypothetical protein
MPGVLLVQIRVMPSVLPVVTDSWWQHPARVYDYWLGGKDNFAADREGAERVLAVTGCLR